jgi:hypothetical protein
MPATPDARADTGRDHAGPRLLAGAPAPPEGLYDADVLILSIDRVDDTLAAIGSALAQQGVSRHVLVLDQGSQPATLAKLAEAIAGRCWRSRATTASPAAATAPRRSGTGG